jgi:hypothetical protein
MAISLGGRWREEHVGVIGPGDYCTGHHAGVHPGYGVFYLLQSISAFFSLQNGMAASILFFFRMAASILVAGGCREDALRALGCCALGAPSDVVACVFRCMCIVSRLAKKEQLHYAVKHYIYHISCFSSFLYPWEKMETVNHLFSTLPIAMLL